MKNNFLKIAKVKDEASFYKKYPSEAAFFKLFLKQELGGKIMLMNLYNQF
jgi:hypothetical protein